MNTQSYFFLLGRVPELSLRELGALLPGVEVEQLSPQLAKVEVAEYAIVDDAFEKSGGCLKLLQVEGEFHDVSEEQLFEYVVAYLAQFPRPTFAIAELGRDSLPKIGLQQVKNALNEQYMKLYNAGNVLAVVFGKLDWQWNFIEAIELSRGEDTVAKFPPARRFPVADGWIVPRQAQHWQTVKAENPGASGTAYREIVPASLNAWDAFKPAIVKRLTAASEVHHVMGKN